MQKRKQSMSRIYCICLSISALLLLFPIAPLFGQSSDYNKKLGIGLFRHTDGTLPTGFFEFQLLPRLGFEFQLGFTRFSNQKYPISPLQNVRQTKFAAGIDARSYFLRSRRHTLEGGFISAGASIFRISSLAEKENFEPIQTMHKKVGLGLGANYYFYKQISFGATTHLNYVSATDLFLSNKGAVIRIQDRTGFILTYSFQIGFSF
jgi:hypothetical protein